MTNILHTDSSGIVIFINKIQPHQWSKSIDENWYIAYILTSQVAVQEKKTTTWLKYYVAKDTKFICGKPSCEETQFQPSAALHKVYIQQGFGILFFWHFFSAAKPTESV